MPPRLLIAFALSVVLHGAVLAPSVLKRPPPRPARAALHARLSPPPAPEARAKEPADFDPLLKDTIETKEADGTEKAAPRAPTPPDTKAAGVARKTQAKREVAVAQRKLSEHLFYPPEAVERGLEGEVRLIVKLGSGGAVEDVALAASCGHAILDNTAIKAAWAMGRLTGATSRELILPVLFRLE